VEMLVNIIIIIINFHPVDHYRMTRDMSRQITIVVKGKVHPIQATKGLEGE
jgi:hypothetical protein